MTYDPTYHSQVHPATEKPEHIGWYASCRDYDGAEDGMLSSFRLPVCKSGVFWWYWNGNEWCADDKAETAIPAIIQNRRWFGLREVKI